MLVRKLIRIDKPEELPGFLGPGHTARPLVRGSFSDTDPFIMMMDDTLDKKDDSPAGGPHPHAGFETVSLLLEGEIGDEAHKMKSGDFQIMTAGSGIVHTETIDKKAKMRLLQLWLNLPRKDRWTTPRVQDLRAGYAPAFSDNGMHIRLYSGSLSGITSPVKNHTSIIVADVTINAGISGVQQIPANFNAFLYVIKGSVKIGGDGTDLKQNQVGWLDLFNDTAQSDLKLTAGVEGVRLILYAGKPTGDDIVSYGPFIADSREEIQGLYKQYRQGELQHISTVPESQRILL